jgi:uncharacterized membrane protein YhaH (DUF805 family)
LKNIPVAFFLGEGRLLRSELIVRLVLLALVCTAFGELAGRTVGEWGSAVMSAVFLWSALAMSIQRLHDIGNSGWWLLWLCLPVLGPVWLVIQLLRRGVEGSNRFGDDPATRADYLKVDIAE